MHNFLPKLLMWAALSYASPVPLATPEDECDMTDCVWPGDANGNAAANAYDLLNIGLGHGAVGPPRPDAHLGWEGQPAPDWGQSTYYGVNYKHLDCDGDGQIHTIDIEAILLNYAAAPPPVPSPQSGGISIYFDFELDSIFVDENSPQYIPINGTLYVAEAQQPAINLHGVGLSLTYNQADIILPGATTAAYNTSSFLGPSYETLWVDQELSGDQRIDMAISRKGGQGVSGYGAVAEVGFVIISDIIGGRSDLYIPLEAVFSGLQVIDQNGAPIPYNISAPSPLVIVNQFVLSAETHKDGSPNIRLFPNPAQDRIALEWSDVEIYQARLCNAQGQELRQLPITLDAGQQEWMLEGLEGGLYALQLQTSKGLVVRKFLVTR